MPHAALCVVQQSLARMRLKLGVCFNAARGFVGGAARPDVDFSTFEDSFNAARGFVGGAASSLAALVPLGEKSPFGKSPEI